MMTVLFKNGKFQQQTYTFQFLKLVSKSICENECKCNFNRQNNYMLPNLKICVPERRRNKPVMQILKESQ